MYDIIQYIYNWIDQNTALTCLAVIVLLSALISVCALRLVVKVAKLPYKKKLEVVPLYYKNKDVPTVELLIVNHGLSTIVIRNILIKGKRKSFVGGIREFAPIVIRPSEYQSLRVDIWDSKDLMDDYGLGFDKQMTIEVRDFEGRVLKVKKRFSVL